MARQNNISRRGVGLVTTLGIIFVILKLTGAITWSWLWVTLPFWGGLVLSLLVGLVMVFIFFGILLLALILGS